MSVKRSRFLLARFSLTCLLFSSHNDLKIDDRVYVFFFFVVFFIIIEVLLIRLSQEDHFSSYSPMLKFMFFSATCWENLISNCPISREEEEEDNQRNIFSSNNLIHDQWNDDVEREKHTELASFFQIIFNETGWKANWTFQADDNWWIIHSFFFFSRARQWGREKNLKANVIELSSIEHSK